MGLFGGSSKVSASTSNNQETVGTSGVVTGDASLASGGSTIINEFGSNVSGAFSSLLDFSKSALNIASESFKTGMTATQSLATQSINTTTAIASQAKQPDLDLLKTYSKFLPWVLIAGVAGVVIITVKK